jgi:hypothetical protein
MKIKMLIATVAVCLTPGWVVAQGCTRLETISSSSASCAVGFVWDSAKSTCVVQVGS